MLELLEDTRLVFTGYPDTRIAHGDVHLPIDHVSRHVHLTAITGELHGIGQQIENHLFDFALVGFDGANRGIDLQAEHDTLTARALADHSQPIFERLGE